MTHTSVKNSQNRRDKFNFSLLLNFIENKSMLDVMEYIQIGMTSLYQEILLKGEKVKEKRNKIRDFVFHYIYLLKLRKERIYG